MRTMVLLITVACCGLSLVFSNHPQMVMAQTQRSDTIYFLGATRGNDYNGTGVLSWCVSKSWHAGYQLPDGTLDPWLSALDEVAQVAPPPPGDPGSWTDTQFYNSCHSDPLGPSGKVDLTTYGVTNQSNCGSPCNSLIVVGSSSTYIDRCQYIEADLWDAGAWDATHQVGHWRGTQIMIHAQAPNATGAPFPLSPIQVTTTGFYASNEIGTIKDDSPCLGGTGWTGYHVHRAFKPPVEQNCSWTRNTLGGFVYQATDRKKGPLNTDHWVHVLNHPFGLFCDDVGKKAADDLLDPSTGALNGDGNGGGTKGLAQGPPGYKITTPQTCFPMTSWCGTMDITQPVLQGALCYNRGMLPVYCFNSWQRRFPPPGGGVTEWYSDATYYYQVTYSHAYPYSGDTDRCGVPNPLGSPIYRIRMFSSQSIGDACGSSALFLSVTQEFFNNSYTATEVQAIFERFRGAGGVNPSVPPSPQDANTWAVTQIDSGHWWDVVQPALDGVIRGARDQRDMATLGITGNPAFDGNPGPTTYSGASVFDRMNTVAYRTTGPRLISRPPKEINSDWIRSTRLTWGPARKTLEMVPN